MVDFINKLIIFPNINIEVIPKYKLYQTELSQILLCEEKKTKSQLCIKVILSEKNDIYQQNVIKNEIYLLQKMRNEKNIVQMYDFTFLQIDNYICYLILMEYCQYHTLFEFIDKNQIIDDNIIFSIIYQIASGLKALHKNKYYHRDLRPENILLRNKNDKFIEIAICDFGSVTNHIYPNEKIKHMQNTNSMNELLFELYSKTNIIYRATEEIFPFSQYPITEKVDIFALGIILVMLLLSYIPSRFFNFQLLLHSSKKIRVQIISEIKNLCNPCFTELLDSVFSTDPTERFTIDEVLNFLILNQNRIKQNNQEIFHKTEKIPFNEIYHKTLYEFEEQDMNNNDYSIKVLTRRILHGKFLNEKGILEAPDCFYINKIIDIIRQEPKQIIDFYINLFSTNVFFYNIFSLKFVFDLHYFVFNFNNNNENKFPNNIELIFHEELNVVVLLDNFSNFFNYKINKNHINKDDFLNLKDSNINNFITKYINFIKKKILLLKNYPLLISNDNTINIKNREEIISQNFIFDIWYLFYLSYQILILIPFQNETISTINELIFNLMNKENVSLCSILLIQLIVLRNKNKNLDFFSKFVEIVEKSAKFFNDLKNKRKEKNPQFEVIYFFKGDNPDKKLKALLNFINGIKYDENFNMREYFKPQSNFRKQFDFIPIKIAYYEKNKYNDVYDDNEIYELNKDINNLVINDKDNQSEENDFNNIFFTKSNANEKQENNSYLNINIININQNNLTSTLLSNISNLSIQSNKNIRNKLSDLISQDINYFLNFQLSKPNYHFIIQPNDLKIFDLIGLGATSEVFLGEYKGLEVAIKKIKVKDINDDFYKEYQNEISILTSIRHPNLISFLGTMLTEEKNDFYLYIITNYCQGGTLYDLLHKKKNISIPWNLKLKFLIEISRAMNFLHTNEPQIIHHDLKSLNILLTSKIMENNSNEHISIKISDFGLSQIITKDIKNSYLKGIGSVQWMAPETLQNNDENDINEKVDVYSFGIIIWEIYARIQPYKNMNISQIINYVCKENGRPNCDLIPKGEMPKGLFELMEKCWDKNPNLRPDFSEILEILNDIKSLGE